MIQSSTIIVQYNIHKPRTLISHNEFIRCSNNFYMCNDFALDFRFPSMKWHFNGKRGTVRCKILIDRQQNFLPERKTMIFTTISLCLSSCISHLVPSCCFYLNMYTKDAAFNKVHTKKDKKKKRKKEILSS